MKPCQMDSGSRDKRSQAREKIQRVKHNMSCSIPVGCFQFVDNLSLGIERESLFTEAGS